MKRHILAGILTAGPLFITWLVFTFILGVLANAGRPLVRLLAAAFPGTAMDQPWVQDVLAVLLTVAVFYVVGRMTSRVVGQQLFGFFEASLERLPLVSKVYTSVRQAVETLTGKKGLGQRVVLVEFPHPGQKALAFLTHVIADSSTGMPIAAVLVPQAINPSSSFLQFVPMEKVVETDLTVEQAMSMLMTGGAVCPAVIRYSAPIAEPVNRDGSALPVSAAVQDPGVAGRAANSTAA
jgi:uncharacterized membrane protein